MSHPIWRNFSTEECYRMLCNQPPVVGEWREMPGYGCWFRADPEDNERAEVTMDDGEYRWGACGERGEEKSLSAAKSKCDELLKSKGWLLVNK